MTVFADVFSRIKNDAAVAAVVNSRIYPLDQVPQNPTYPLITFGRIDSQRQVTLDSDGTLVNTRFQVEAWADSTFVADDLIEKCRLAMTGSSVAFTATTATGPIDTIDPDLDKKGTIIDFSVWHN